MRGRQVAEADHQRIDRRSRPVGARLGIEQVVGRQDGQADDRGAGADRADQIGRAGGQIDRIEPAAAADAEGGDRRCCVPRAMSKPTLASVSTPSAPMVVMTPLPGPLGDAIDAALPHQRVGREVDVEQRRGRCRIGVVAVVGRADDVGAGGQRGLNGDVAVRDVERDVVVRTIDDPQAGRWSD